MKAAVLAMSKTPAVVGHESSDDDVEIMDAGLSNPVVAEDMVGFLESMGVPASMLASLPLSSLH